MVVDHHCAIIDDGSVVVALEDTAEVGERALRVEPDTTAIAYGHACHS